jgi:alkylhydroperoxidase family enzyme
VGTIRPNLPLRRYELATLAAARALRSSYCSLAHGRVLAAQVFDAATVKAIRRGDGTAAMEPAEIAMMDYVEKVVRNANQVTE